MLESSAMPSNQPLNGRNGTRQKQETIIITIIRLGGFIFLRVNLPVKISFIITPSSFIISHMVFLKATNTATSVPR